MKKTKQANSSSFLKGTINRVSNFWKKYDNDYEYSASTNYWIKDSLFDKKVSMFEKESEDRYDHFALAQYKRAITNFVHIMTADKTIKVVYNNKDLNNTDGKTINLSASIKEKDFDANVGLALHESSHILYTDFNFVNNVLNRPYHEITSSDGISILDGINVPDSGDIITDISIRTSDNGLYHHAKKQLFTILNIVEDLYIDALSYMKAPGYRGYYKSLYQKYFGDDKITRGFYDKKFHKPTLNNYFYHICNIRNPYRNLNALPSLEEIWNLLDIKNIKRLTTQQDRLDVAIKIFNIILKNVKIEEEKNSNKNSKSGDSDSENGDSENGDSDNYSNDIDATVSSQNIPDGVETKPLNEKQLSQIEKLLEKQIELINGEINKTKLAKSDIDRVEAIDSVDIKEQKTGKDIVKDGIKTFILRNVNESFMKSDLAHGFGISISRWRSRNVEKSIVLGKLLAKKLQLRNEERSIASTRLKSGKIDARLLHEIGFDNYEIFKKINITEHTPSHIHISIDQSSSMGGLYFEESIKFAVMFATASKLIKNIHVVVTARSTYYRNSHKNNSMKNVPYIMYLFDSKKNNINHIRTVFANIRANAYTPEGLTFEAIYEEIVKQSANTDAYFINLCDGEPSSDNYYGLSAKQHSRKQADKIMSKGVSFMSYFFGSEYGFNRVKEVYPRNSYRLENADDVNKIVKYMNDQLLKSVNSKN
jgi:hypothetical protein